MSGTFWQSTLRPKVRKIVYERSHGRKHPDTILKATILHATNECNDCTFPPTHKLLLTLFAVSFCAF